MESADFRSICQETIQTILKKEEQLEYVNEGYVCLATVVAIPLCRVIEVQGANHSIYKSRPKEVAALIEEAARHAQDQ
jgi:hypothetical protein